MRLRILALGAAVVVMAATAVGVVLATEEEPVCGCSIAVDARTPALNAAGRFETAVRGGDVAGAWAMLTEGAQARYVDVAGFRPVAERLGAAFRGVARWLPLAEEVDYSFARWSDVVVARHSAAQPQTVWPMVIQVRVGKAPAERVDPEPAALAVRVTSDGPDTVQVEAPDTMATRSFVVVDRESKAYPIRGETVLPGVHRLRWTGIARETVVIVVVARTGDTWQVGAASTAPA
jgi:hypothetical protein